MDAKEISMFRFLDGADKKFIIPVYQRAYSWKRENCASLLKDLMNVYEHDHVSHFFFAVLYTYPQNGLMKAEKTSLNGMRNICKIYSKT